MVEEFSVYVTYSLLICSPRYTEKLASNIKRMGGACYMFLTHKYAEYTLHLLISNICDIIVMSTLIFRDDVADHYKWSKELGCERILHSEEVR